MAEGEQTNRLAGKARRDAGPKTPSKEMHRKKNRNPRRTGATSRPLTPSKGMQQRNSRDPRKARATSKPLTREAKAMDGAIRPSSSRANPQPERTAARRQVLPRKNQAKGMTARVSPVPALPKGSRPAPDPQSRGLAKSVETVSRAAKV